MIALAKAAGASLEEVENALEAYLWANSET